MKLVIGNKNYSSWSLRAWLFMRWSELEFEEVRVPLFVEGWKKTLSGYTPAARVPVLLDGDLRVWDTYAIFDHLREQHPHSALPWPSDPEARAACRSISAEMHSGFLAMRGRLPQNIRARNKVSIDGELRTQVDRVLEIWNTCRSRYAPSGPWLFGERSLADVMYAPVALRFQTYRVEVPGKARSFREAVVSDSEVQDWTAASEKEEEAWPVVDELRDLENEELTLG